MVSRNGTSNRTTLDATSHRFDTARLNIRTATVIPSQREQEHDSMNPTPRPFRSTPTSPTRVVVAAVGLALLLGTASSCKSTGEPSTSTSNSNSAEGRYLIGPSAASDLGLRILWQQDVPLGNATGLKRVALVGPDLVTVDANNRLTMLRIDDGYQIWHAAPLPPRETVLGLDRIDSSQANQIFVTTDTDIFVVDVNTGHMTTRQDLPHQPSTGVVRVGPDLVYGTGGGRIIWHNAVVGYEIRANRINGAVTATPLLIDNEIVAVSAAGAVKMMNASSGQQLWTRQLTAGIKASPAAGDRAVYVAGLGQSIWCLDRSTGSALWKYFTESPLTSGPTVLGDRVFQYIASEGLVCLDALPENKPKGEVLWKNPKLTGEVITVIGNDLVLWDEPTHTLTLVDADRGDAKKAVTLKNVDHVHAYRPAGGDLVFVASSNSGRVQRLVPLNR